MQPQEVNLGSTTPTCFNVAWGNLSSPELILKLTYDLCYIYSNWNGSISAPNVLKTAGKLAKTTAKYSNSELNKNLEKGQAYI